MFRPFWVTVLVPVLLFAACGKQAETRKDPTTGTAPVVPAEVKVPENFGWEKIAGDERTTAYVDTLNVDKDMNGDMIAWSRVEHLEGLNIGPIRNIKSELHRIALNCKEKTMVITFWVAMDKDNKELLRRGMQVRESAGGNPEEAAKSIASKVYQHMCNSK